MAWKMRTKERMALGDVEELALAALTSWISDSTDFRPIFRQAI
jgi:hypothetical protein